ncbi:hypothetical protein BBKW_0202 [Bifidobacterium catenulatum subsp. kashiwanohense JCM 15439 = DSM 21854]|nr:hypothetical protein BBKW_0202 [Bifidobacterium catenulatum subsp. kashiwanohense JCM 15439 = DSM 21854]
MLNISIFVYAPRARRRKGKYDVSAVPTISAAAATAESAAAIPISATTAVSAAAS